MLFIPFDRAVNWRKPPIITILLVLANIFIYFTFQVDENKWRSEAYKYYIQSGLDEIEYPLYKKFREDNAIISPPFFATKQADDWFAIESDHAFQESLNHNHIIPPSNKQYEVWREKRDKYNQILAKIVTQDYQLVPANPTIQGMFGHQFLHGSVGHLLGNMLFLFSIGFLVEATLGSFAYFTLYLIGGLGAGAMFIFLNSGSHVPLVGASGAIAGLMGLYTVLYGFRKVRFFYFILVYFNFIVLPAIVMLPIWIGKELYMMLTDSGSNVAYAAHFGGLVMGAAVGGVAKQIIPSYRDNIQQIDEQKKTDHFETDLDQALDLCAHLEYQKAQPLLKKLYYKKPTHPTVLFHLQQCYRFNTSQPQYKILSHKVFLLNGRGDSQVTDWIEDVYLHYSKVLNIEEIPFECSLSLANTFLYAGQVKLAQSQINLLIKKEITNPKVQELIERLANLLKKKDQIVTANEYLHLLKQARLSQH